MAELGEHPLDVDAHLGHRSADRPESSGVVGLDDRVVPRHVPADELQRQPRLQDDGDGVGVHPHVELRHRALVADVVGDRAHDDAALHAAGEGRIAPHGDGDVGQRPERDEGQVPRVTVRGGEERVDGVAGRGGAPGEREPDVAHPVGPVDVLAGLERDDERGVGARVDGHVHTAQLGHVEGVLHGEIEGHVAGDDPDADDVDVGVTQRHHEGDGVVTGGVGVDEERAHRRIVAEKCERPGWRLRAARGSSTWDEPSTIGRPAGVSLSLDLTSPVVPGGSAGDAALSARWPVTRLRSRHGPFTLSRTSPRHRSDTVRTVNPESQLGWPPEDSALPLRTTDRRTGLPSDVAVGGIRPVHRSR